MEILNVGPLEFLLIVVLALILIGPKDLVKIGRQTGRLLRKIRKSSFWTEISDVNREITSLPQKLMRDAELEDVLKQGKDFVRNSPVNQARGNEDVDRGGTDNTNSILPPTFDEGTFLADEPDTKTP